jgi:hypothetical protein
VNRLHSVKSPSPFSWKSHAPTADLESGPLIDLKYLAQLPDVQGSMTGAAARPQPD